MYDEWNVEEERGVVRKMVEKLNYEVQYWKMRMRDVRRGRENGGGLSVART